MKHPEGRITAQIRSDRLLGCSSTSTGAGDAERNTPTGVEHRGEQAQHARLAPEAAQHRRNGGLTNHFSPKPFACDSGGCYDQIKVTYGLGQPEDSRAYISLMRRLTVAALIMVTIVGGCGGPLPTGNAATGTPVAIAQVGAGGQREFRLFDAFNSDFTVHVPLLSGDTTRLEIRLYDSSGVQRTAIPGGAEVTFHFTPPPRWAPKAPSSSRFSLSCRQYDQDLRADPSSGALSSRWCSRRRRRRHSTMATWGVSPFLRMAPAPPGCPRPPRCTASMCRRASGPS